jgi:hypothetical protein
MSYATINGVDVEWLDLDRPFQGNWTLRARIDLGDSDALPLGPLTLVFDTGAEGVQAVTYAGTILESTHDQGEGYIYAVGGAGGLRGVLAGDDYAAPPPRVVASAILAAAGESLGDLSGLDTLARIEPFYGRLAGTGTAQLDRLCRTLGVTTWRVRPDGAVDVFVPAWPTFEGDAFLGHFPNASGVAHAEPDLPTIDPGMVVDGLRVSRVRYFVDDTGLSAKLTTEAS